MPQIDYFLSTISPFTYLAGTRLEEIAAKHGATVTYKPVDIGGLFGRTGGTALKDRPEGRREYRLQEMTRQAAKAGMKINLQPMFWPANGRDTTIAKGEKLRLWYRVLVFSGTPETAGIAAMFKEFSTAKPNAVK